MDPVVHFELPFENRERMAKFYRTVFGWKTEMLGTDMGDYVLVTTAEADVKPGTPAGAINGGLYLKKADSPAQHPSIVIAVADVRGSMKKIASAGGRVLGEPMEIPEVGQYVSFLDTEGNRNSLLQPKAMTRR